MLIYKINQVIVTNLIGLKSNKPCDEFDSKKTNRRLGLTKAGRYCFNYLLLKSCATEFN